MKEANDLILHPVRMRILIAIAGRELSVAQLANHLPDIAPATLYRHIKTLVDADLLVVTQEWQRGSSTDRTYRLNESAASLKVNDFSSATADDHMRYFVSFISGLLASFSKYRMAHERDGKLDVVGDGVLYTSAPINLSDAEFRQVSNAFQAIIGPLLNNLATPERKRRLLTTIVIPDDEP